MDFQQVPFKTISDSHPTRQGPVEAKSQGTEPDLTCSVISSLHPRMILSMWRRSMIGRVGKSSFKMLNKSFPKDWTYNHSNAMQCGWKEKLWTNTKVQVNFLIICEEEEHLFFITLPAKKKRGIECQEKSHNTGTTKMEPIQTHRKMNFEVSKWNYRKLKAK